MAPKVNYDIDFKGMTRRSFLGAGLALGAGVLIPIPSLAWDRPASLNDAIAKSTLVYLSPLQSDGSESACHGEVWFARDGEDLLVVTNPERWRAAAIGRGLNRARLWVGDYGLWKKAEDRFRAAPACVAMARIEKDKDAHTRALVSFGEKYTAEWSSWGPRFKEGLLTGTRVLIRYSPVEA